MGSIFRNLWFWVIVLIVAVLLFLAHQTGVERARLSPPEQAVRYVYAPLQVGLDRVKTGIMSLDEYFVSKKRLAEENRKLKGKIRDLSLENQQLKEYREEAQRLETILAFRDYTPDYRLLGARVVARSPNYWNDTIIIDRGSADGVKKDMVVITPEGLVGRILNVQAKTSEVLLITSRESGVGTVVQETRAPGIVNGGGDSGHLIMSNIPYFVNISPGEQVVTSGLGSIFPPGIPVGRVMEVKKEQSGLTHTAVLQPNADLQRLQEVLVVLSYRGTAAKEIMPDLQLMEQNQAAGGGPVR